MQRTPQMESIVRTIQAFKLELDTKLLELEGTDRQSVSAETFANQVTGLQTMRRLPGVPEPMGFEGMYKCPSDEDAKELREYLDGVFGIHDEESLGIQAHEFFHIQHEYADFLADWNETPNFDIKELDAQSLAMYQTSRDFAEYFRDLVGMQGFLAWDIGERAMLIRAAYACGVISEDYAIQCLNAEIELAFTNFQNWAEFAISLACGCVYYMFASTGRTEDDGLEDFLKINLNIIRKLFDDHTWTLSSWFYVERKKLAINPEQVEQLLDEEMSDLTCICSDRILCDGYRVAVMARDKALNPQDSGWRFFAGDETQEYIDAGNNFGVVPLNLVCNYSKDIIPLLDAAPGNMFARDNTDVFRPHNRIDEQGNYHPLNEEDAKINGVSTKDTDSDPKILG